MQENTRPGVITTHNSS